MDSLKPASWALSSSMRAPAASSPVNWASCSSSAASCRRNSSSLGRPSAASKAARTRSAAAARRSFRAAACATLSALAVTWSSTRSACGNCAAARAAPACSNALVSFRTCWRPASTSFWSRSRTCWAVARASLSWRAYSPAAASASSALRLPAASRAARVALSATSRSSTTPASVRAWRRARARATCFCLSSRAKKAGLACSHCCARWRRWLAIRSRSCFASSWTSAMYSSSIFRGRLALALRATDCPGAPGA